MPHAQDWPRRLRAVDSHTEGEPTRVFVDGIPGVEGTPSQARAILDGRLAPLARALLAEPRGCEWLVGAAVLPPTADAACGVVFFNNVGTLGMCGHGTIGLVRTLAHLGRLGPGACLIETPVGVVEATNHLDGRVSVRNVPSRVGRAHAAVRLADGGVVHGDIAWGGNWFFICHDHGVPIEPACIPLLSARAQAIADALDAQGIRGDDGGRIDHIELAVDRLASPGGVGPGADSRNFVLCPGGEWDRSPCGTGTSARLACLAASGALAPGAPWVQESVIGTRFTATYACIDGGIVPTITGSAHVTFDGHIHLDPTDALVGGAPAVRARP